MAGVRVGNGRGPTLNTVDPSSAQLPKSVVNGSSGAGAVVGPTVGPYFNIGKFRLRDFYTIVDFGAVQDGVTVDDNAYAEGAAYLASLSPNSGGDLWVPPSQFQSIISVPIVLPNGVRLRGQAYSSCYITAKNGFTGTAMIVPQHTDGSQEWAAVEGIRLNGNGHVANCINFSHLSAPTSLREVWVSGATAENILITECNDTSLWNVVSDSPGTDGISIIGGNTVNLFHVLSQSAAAGSACVRITKGVNTSKVYLIHGLHIETAVSGIYGLILDGAGGLLTCVDVVGMGFVGGPGTIIDLIKLQNATISGLTVRGLYVDPTKLTGQVINDTINGVQVPPIAGVFAYNYTETRVVGATGQPAFAGDWANVAGNKQLSFFKDDSGNVNIGPASLTTPGGQAANANLFSLPVGYRPSTTVTGLTRLGATGGLGRYVISSSGAITIADAVGAGNGVILHPIIFQPSG